jgi:hypothetical protein
VARARPAAQRTGLSPHAPSPRGCRPLALRVRPPSPQTPPTPLTPPTTTLATPPDRSAGALSRIPSPAIRARLDAAPDRAALEGLASEFVAAIRAGSHAAQGWGTSMYGISKVGARGPGPRSPVNGGTRRPAPTPGAGHHNPGSRPWRSANCKPRPLPQTLGLQPQNREQRLP